MLEMLLLMAAVAVNSGAGAGDSAVALEMANEEPVTEEATADAISTAPPSDQAPVAEQQAAVAPSFLAPAADPEPSASAPLFLAPGAAKSEPAPAFLAPAANPGLVAEPQTPTGRFTTATEVKPILNATKGNWIHVREFDGKDLLYVTHLWSWRCGLLEMRVGINGDDPVIWPLPDCHLDQQTPAAILEQDGLPYAEFGLGTIALIEVALTYDDLTTDSAKFNRNGMLLP